MIEIKNLALGLSVACMSVGCANALQLLGAANEGSGGDEQKRADEQGYQSIKADYAKARAGGVPADPKVWSEVRDAWYRAAVYASSASRACDKPDRSYSTQVGRDSPHCPEYKEIAEKARVGYVEFLSASAESSAVDYAELQRHVIDASQDETYAALLPTVQLLAKLAEKKKAWFADRFREFGDLRQHVAAQSTGTCVFAERSLPKEVKSTDAMTYLTDFRAPKLFIRCVTPNKLSTYQRDQADQLALEVRVEGDWYVVHRINVENPATQGDTFEVELPAAVVRSKVTESSKRLGSGAWMRASYFNSKISKVERTFENGKVIDRPIWKHDAIASGSLYLELTN